MGRYFLGMVKYIWWLNKWNYLNDFKISPALNAQVMRHTKGFVLTHRAKVIHLSERKSIPSDLQGQMDKEGGWSWGGFLVQPCDHVTVMKVFTKIVTPRSPSVTCNFWEVTHGSGNDRQFFVTLAKVFATWPQKRFAHISSARWLGKCRNGSHKEALFSSQK